MDDESDLPSLTEYLAEKGVGASSTLREHLVALASYDDDLYVRNAQATIESLEAEHLEGVPIDVDQEESPYCVAYYLPDNQLIRVLPDYSFEILTWEAMDDDEVAEALDS